MSYIHNSVLLPNSHQVFIWWVGESCHPTDSFNSPSRIRLRLQNSFNSRVGPPITRDHPSSFAHLQHFLGRPMGSSFSLPTRINSPTNHLPCTFLIARLRRLPQLAYLRSGCASCPSHRLQVLTCLLLRASWFEIFPPQEAYDEQDDYPYEDEIDEEYS